MISDDLSEMYERGLLRKITRSPRACRAIATALEIEQDGSEDVSQYVRDALLLWVHESTCRENRSNEARHAKELGIAAPAR